MYVDNLRMVYEGIMEIHKLHTYEYNCNVYINKLGVVGCLENMMWKVVMRILWKYWIRVW